MKKKLKAVFLIITSILLIINLFLIISGYCSLFGFRTLTIVSGSMEDYIKTNSIVIIKKSDYKINDIVTIKYDNYFVTHRLVEINGDSIITKGDANNTIDNASSKENIVGKVIFVMPRNCYLTLKIIAVILIIVSILISKKENTHE